MLFRLIPYHSNTGNRCFARQYINGSHTEFSGRGQNIIFTALSASQGDFKGILIARYGILAITISHRNDLTMYTPHLYNLLEPGVTNENYSITIDENNNTRVILSCYKPWDSINFIACTNMAILVTREDIPED